MGMELSVYRRSGPAVGRRVPHVSGLEGGEVLMSRYEEWAASETRAEPPIRRRTEPEVAAYVAGYRAAINAVLRTAGLELSEETAEKIRLFGEIVGTGV